MKIVDVNILLYAGNTDAAEHEVVRNWWENALSGEESIGLAWSVILGFVRISTHPAVLPRPNTIEEVCGKVERWLQRRVVSVIHESAGHWPLLANLLLSADVRGNLVTDAHLAALAMDHGATLVSCDSDFSRFDGLRWENPLQSLG